MLPSGPDSFYPGDPKGVPSGPEIGLDVEDPWPVANYRRDPNVAALANLAKWAHCRRDPIATCAGPRRANWNGARRHGDICVK